MEIRGIEIQGMAMRSLKVLLWVAVAVVVLTAAQYGSVHLLNGRPSSWLFEASLDFGPPLLFFGDLVQLAFNHGSQAPLRYQPGALVAGVLANIALYGIAALIVMWVFFPAKGGSSRLA
jgi:hypothetical protein